MKTRLLLIALYILFLAAYSGAEERIEESVHAPQEKGTVKIPDEENVYVIKKGDTLWHISEMFLKNPFKWPDLWKTNPYIANPHLIYPGNTVKILPTGIVVSGEKAKKAAIEAVPEGLPVEKLQKLDGPSQPEEQMKEVLVKVEEPALPKPPEEKPAPQPTHEIVKVASAIMGRHGFISVKDVEGDGMIIGSKAEGLLLSQGDMVYISLRKGTAVKEGDKFNIFTTTDKVKHPVTEKPMGFLTDIIGALEVTKVEKDGVITARIEKSYKEISKGARLKSYEPPIQEVRVKKTEKTVDGLVIASIEDKVGLAESDIVYLDKGKNSGIDVGNIMHIFRPFIKVEDPMSKDKKTITLPSIELGRLIIIRVEDDTSTAFITKSRQVIYRGDRVRTAE